MKKYKIIFKNYRLEPITVDQISAREAAGAMKINGLWEYKGRFFQGSAIDAVEPVAKEKFIELPTRAEKPVTKETLRRVADELGRRGYNVKKPQ